ncbi:MAG: ATP-binding protein, partial [Thiohalobacterales bacterium]|nr:ATP-binding protein [Thiohalobacterales bacterium]
LSDIELAATDVNAMLRKVEASTALQSTAARIDFAFDYGEIPLVKTSEFHLEQAVKNVVNNAIEAMAGTDTGTRMLTIASRQADSERIEVSVHDTGPGLDPATTGTMYDAFTSTKAGGMGLGLAISRSIIEAHGGRLMAVSEPGAGATFSFDLPVTRIQ